MSKGRNKIVTREVKAYDARQAAQARVASNGYVSQWQQKVLFTASTVAAVATTLSMRTSAESDVGSARNNVADGLMKGRSLNVL